ncbi:acyl-CoA synthetase [Candidatus Pseudothioglobus singularis]|uniref:Acyl-CoA synthetase n=1 Tax=Candidatus Pseudothioglobus singularis PS1 TaxID=1125411 RepID=A0A0M3T2B3_9GAMM|nr:acyl-CoA synthetase [Candidatus Pseudothioglobus singularis]ALE02551.1 acyl-CoA synthetase [Candidatus Pseudothioglobus singularis PS1]
MAKLVAMNNPYNTNLDRNPANFQPLTPLTFLERAASVYPNHTAIVHGKLRRNYSDFYSRSRQLASALSEQGIARGDTVSVILSNTPAMLEAHYGVPMCGAVLHSINTRLDPDTIAYQLDHANSKALIVDREFLKTAKTSLELAGVSPILIEFNDSEYPIKESLPGAIEYGEFLLKGDKNYNWLMPEDEWDAISLNYTSGTTGNPKGVVSHHRGAYLLAQGNAMIASIKKHSVYLWTLPMFHCNGWCFPWTMSAIIGTHVCLRRVMAEPIWESLAEHKVTHLCGAPIVMSTILAASDNEKKLLEKQIDFFTAAAPPPESVLTNMKDVGFNITHLYGLSETYGPAVVNEWHQEWDVLDDGEQASLKARQGVRYLPLESLAVMDPKTMRPVPRDGKTIGEVMFRGNVVMKGYLKNKAATDESFKDGWFHSGDLGVIHEDGYIQLKDRSKDIIISGGENISSIEIEEVLYKHPSVEAAAVVAMPDEKWGETPCAFVQLKKESHASEEELSQWCRDHMASFKLPRQFYFEDIPKTSTGKVQKFILREQVKNL